MNARWPDIPIADRVRCVCALRHVLARRAAEAIDLLRLPWRRSPAETLGAEITPLADACKFLQQRAAALLALRRLGSRRRPAWLFGVEAEIHRPPLGVVLIIGPANYPLMLPGIQIAQALVAGNEVLFKPAPGTTPIALWLAERWRQLGVPASALTVLDEDPSSIDSHLARVNKVILTGSEATGRAVMKRCADYLIPSAMELSGCDALIVLPGADLDRVAACVRFGLEFNSSASCISARRVMIDPAQADALAEKIKRAAAGIAPVPVAPAAMKRLSDLAKHAVAAGASLLAGSLPVASPMPPLVLDHVTPGMPIVQQDLMAPLTSVLRLPDVAAMLAAQTACPYALGAAIFGPADAARKVARQLNVGSVVINDLMVPTADPRVPFGGRARSGFGVTRGAEGLLEMTCIKTVLIRRRGPMFHLRTAEPSTELILRHQLELRHGEGFITRVAALFKLAAAARRSH